MRVRLVAADSMGVRSLATHVEMCGLSIAVDLSASLAPRRYGLPPHELELRELDSSLERIRGLLQDSHVAVITHYHYDHYLAGEPELYYGKHLLVKHPRSDINVSQRIRAHRFLVKGGIAERARVSYADGMEYVIDGVRFRFSPPVWHGEPGTKVGKVVMVAIECDEGRVVYASDVQGPVDEEARNWLAGLGGADLLVIDGPPTYFAGYKVPREAVEDGFRGFVEVVRRLKPHVVVVDHHLARDKAYEDILGDLRRRVGGSSRIVSAAEFMGREPRLLEAYRRELWRGEWLPGEA
ncbi:MAG: MBL fold metallo-hydrolase [Desulfurococcales archaeon]|nr:MBL fold metallo-hydrolase [Desulfurococcales archaeon]